MLCRAGPRSIPPVWPPGRCPRPRGPVGEETLGQYRAYSRSTMAIRLPTGCIDPKPPCSLVARRTVPRLALPGKRPRAACAATGSGSFERCCLLSALRFFHGPPSLQPFLVPVSQHDVPPVRIIGELTEEQPLTQKWGCITLRSGISEEREPDRKQRYG